MILREILLNITFAMQESIETREQKRNKYNKDIAESSRFSFRQI